MQALLSLFRTAPARCIITTIPTELILAIASHLNQVRDINALLRASRRLASILSPILSTLGAAATDGDSGRSLLHWAAATGRTDLLTILLHHGADANTRHRQTALHSAVLGGHPHAVRILLANGADKEAVSEHGWTPLHIAAITGCSEIAGLLVEYGANMEARSSTLLGKTALHYAGLCGHRRVVELLVQSGADVAAQDEAKMTVAQMAAMVGHQEIVGILLDTDNAGELISGEDVGLATSLVELECWIVQRYIHYLMWIEQRALKFRASRHQ